MKRSDYSAVSVETIECRKVREHLPEMLFEEAGSVMPPAFFEHLRQCPGCLRLHLAVEAAAELASPQP